MSNNVLIVVEARGGNVKRPSLEALGAGIELAAETPELRRELMLMACHCLQGEIRHLLMGD